MVYGEDEATVITTLPRGDKSGLCYLEFRAGLWWAKIASLHCHGAVVWRRRWSALPKPMRCFLLPKKERKAVAS